LQRLMATADSANGIASRLDFTHWLFLNTDLSVHLHRRPTGEWFGVDAETVIGAARWVGAGGSQLPGTHGPAPVTVRTALPGWLDSVGGLSTVRIDVARRRGVTRRRSPD
jgi:hypothetical protein